MTLSPMTMADYAEVYRLWQACDGICLRENDDSQPAIARYLERHPGLSVVARDDDERVLGAVLVGHDGRRGLLHHPAVDPTCRRQGLGGKLVAQALANLENVGIVRCYILILRNNPAGQAFWEHLGWTVPSHVSLAAINLDGASATKGPSCCH